MKENAKKIHKSVRGWVGEGEGMHKSVCGWVGEGVGGIKVYVDGLERGREKGGGRIT